ncbi:tetratricopeptide repeat protein [Kibdelosporangium philippinense]|uniref:Tetratricopeptide repeat protein n=1 Tax=Kibdelosporangium philippinense TaxID=211113 RepID=A0ABS8ZCP9_9PSEU|nr:BTAD domain-containing putative transcriptional regulator [Kibdelosporangium philippinense]MCE7005282.1 tetratricopeptide repeat protein [Kibdelosporangium philippinense]
MEFRILGPPEIQGPDGLAQPRGDRQHVLLSALLLQADRVVPVDQLIDAIWGDDPPATGPGALYTLVSRLRRVLDAAGAGERLISLPSGYRLHVEPGELDLARFRAHVERGRAADQPATAAQELHAGLKLWRGRVLDGVPGAFAEANATRLHQEHLAAVEDRIGADLAMGTHAELVPELGALIAEHPLREGLRGQLMLALFRAGQQADALLAFQDARRTLIDSLGIEPGQDLQDLHQRILLGDPSLAVRQARQRRNTLPRDITDFTGRESELRRMLDDLSQHETVIVSTIDGMAGAGKTALAVHAAHRLAEHYADGQLFIELHAHTAGQEPTPPGDALDALLGALGVPADRIPNRVEDRAALWRAELADRRVLVVLDNAADAAQVRPLLPGGVGCLTLITSRRRLVDLDDVRTVTLGELPPDEALAMFSRIVGDARPAAEADVAKEIVRLCGYLPLAIRIAGARLRSRPAWSIQHLAQRLRESRPLAAGDRSVAAAFELSYRYLTTEQQRVFRLMGLHAGPDFGAHLAAAVTGIDLDTVEQVLEDLVDVHLLQQNEPGRFRFHDLVRRHARALVSTEDEEPAVARLLDYFLHTAELAARRIHPRGYRMAVHVTWQPPHTPDLDSYDVALSWLETERDNLTAATTFAAEHDRLAHAWQIPHMVWYFSFLRGYTHDWIATHQVALAAARQLGDHAAEAETLHSLGGACWRVGRFDEAIEHWRRAMELFRAAGNRRGEGKALHRFGLINAFRGDLDEAVHHYEQALPLLRETGEQWTEAIVLTHLAGAYALAGKEDKAMETYGHAAAVVDEMGEKWVDSCVRVYFGAFYRQTGRYQEALDQHWRALALKREIGDRGAESELLSDLGDTYLAAGQPDRAISLYEQSLALATDVLDRKQQNVVRRKLADAVADIR